MNNMERINMLNQAVQLIEEAQGLVDEALSDTTMDGEYRSYGRFGFDQLLGNGNPYDTSLNNVLERLENEDDDDEEE